MKLQELIEEAKTTQQDCSALHELLVQKLKEANLHLREVDRRINRLKLLFNETYERTNLLLGEIKDVINEDL